MTTPHSIQELCGRTIHSIKGDMYTSTVTFYDRDHVPLFSADIRELWAQDGNRFIERINNAVNYTADQPRKSHIATHVISEKGNATPTRKPHIAPPETCEIIRDENGKLQIMFNGKQIVNFARYPGKITFIDKFLPINPPPDKPSIADSPLWLYLIPLSIIIAGLAVIIHR